MKTDHKEQDKLIIRDPNKWPQWPYLPVKKHLRYELKCGVIIEDGAKDVTIYMTNLFNLPKTSAEFKALPQVKYNSVDELLNDGWEVD